MSRKRKSARIDAYRDFCRDRSVEKQRGHVSLATTNSRSAKSRRAKREHTIDRVMDQMRHWSFTPFENEAPMRHGLRSAFCLQGIAWSAADKESEIIVSSALNRIGAERPTWDQGQREYVTPRENCQWCGGPIDEEDRTGGRSYRFCSPSCAKSALRWREVETTIRDNEVMRSALAIVTREKQPKKICEACGHAFHPTAGRNRYCSPRCKHIGLRTVPERPCGVCGTPFRPSGNDPRKGKYCSSKCAYSARRTSMQFSCIECGELYVAQASKADRTKFCSPECKKAHGFIARYPARCDCCRKPFIAKKPNTAYCSKRCSAIARNIAMGHFPLKNVQPVFDYLFTRHRRTSARRGMTTALFDRLFREAA